MSNTPLHYKSCIPRFKQRYLWIKEVVKMTGLTVSKIYHLKKDRRFPQPVKFKKRICWPQHEIEAWIKNNPPS